MRTTRREHTIIILGHDKLHRDFRFRITNEEEQNIKDDVNANARERRTRRRRRRRRREKYKKKEMAV
jgi:hypothetical protein